MSFLNKRKTHLLKSVKEISPQLQFQNPQNLDEKI